MPNLEARLGSDKTPSVYRDLSSAAAIQGRASERHYATFSSEVGVWRRTDRWRELIEARRAAPASPDAVARLADGTS